MLANHVMIQQTRWPQCTGGKIEDLSQGSQILLNDYALVICNHRPPQAKGRAGDKHGNERVFDQSFASAVQGKYPGFAFVTG